MAAAALQVCPTHHLTIRSSTPKTRATIRVDIDEDDGSAHRVLWVGDGASLTLVDIMLTGGRSLMRGGGVKLDTAISIARAPRDLAATQLAAFVSRACSASHRSAVETLWCSGRTWASAGTIAGAATRSV